MKLTVLNEPFTAERAHAIRDWTNARPDQERRVLYATVTLNVPVNMRLFKDAGYTFENIKTALLDDARHIVMDEDTVLIDFMGDIVLNELKVISMAIEPETASISDTMAHFDMSDAEWDATLPSVQHKLRNYTHKEANKN